MGGRSWSPHPQCMHTHPPLFCTHFINWFLCVFLIVVNYVDVDFCVLFIFKKGSFLSEGVHVTVLQQSCYSHQGVGRWGEGDRAFPLKKRRGSFERRSNEETIMDTRKKMKTKMKTKMENKCLQQNGDSEEDDKETKEGASSKVKTKVRGGALLEGSRCSRVNGKGWRCCQQTLVGYSLCEHHLGKGRLRSMNSVRSRSIATTVPKKDEYRALSSPSLLLSLKK
nr:uncharacterized protein LOC118043886 [Populus alba]